MKVNYPMINNGLISVIDYQTLIKMQSQEPVITFSKNITLNGKKDNNYQQKRVLKRTTNK